MTFGDYLAQLRKNVDLTTRELEDLSGVSNSYISQLENGKREIPHPDILRKLADPLKTTYRYLMEIAGYLDGIDLYRQESTSSSINKELIKDMLHVILKRL